MRRKALLTRGLSPSAEGEASPRIDGLPGGEEHSAKPATHCRGEPGR